MAIVTNNRQNNRISKKSKNKLVAVRVIDIILDLNHPKAESLGGYDSIGTIFYSVIEKNTATENKNFANYAKPLFTHLKYYPLINEVVLILTTSDKDVYKNSLSLSTYYLPQVNMWGHPHHNALPSLQNMQGDENTQNDYQETENGLVRKTTDDGTNIPLGRYFKEQLNIKPLLPYEGDMLIEGRFGNSIRFGSTVKQKIQNSEGEEIQVIPDSNKNSWSEINEEKGGENGNPIIIIRNGQSEELDEQGWIHTIEDVNNDASSIYLTSNQSIEKFEVSSLHQLSFGADIEPPKQEGIIITTPEPEEAEEPEITDEEIPDGTEPTETTETPLDPVDEEVENPPTELNQEVIEEIEEEIEETDELTPFDELAEETAVGYYEAEEETDAHAVSIGSGVMITIQANQITGDINTGTEIGNRGWILADFLKSQKAEEKNINNAPGIDGTPTTDQIIDNLNQLMENVGDLIYDQYPNMQITSGYRCIALNEALKSDKNSEHRFGFAIDFQVPGTSTQDIFNWCVNNLPTYNQLIWEYPERESDSWIHVSYQSGRNRKRNTLATTNDDLHALYGGTRRRDPETGNYQDGITEAKLI